MQSQQRAAKAWDEGRFKNSVIPVKDVNGLTILAKDEHMRPTTTMQSLGQLKASFEQMGVMGGFDAVAIQSHPEVEKINYVHHAGNSSGIVDGAGAVLLGSKEAGAKHGLKPRAKIRAFANIGSAPAMMLRAWARKAVPASVSSTFRLVRKNSTVPNSCSRSRICWLSGGCEICNRCAAAVKLNSSAKAMK